MELEQWKQKYYEQLDRLEEKEQSWHKLERILKKTIGRISLAAEGQHASLDRHLAELRNSLKNTINEQHLESVVTDISQVISQLEEKQAGSNRQSIDLLEQLLKHIKLPNSLLKPRKKLLKKFSQSDDSNSQQLLSESLDLLTLLFAEAPEKSGILTRLFQPQKKNSSADSHHIKTDPTADKNKRTIKKINVYKDCLIELLNKMDNPQSPNGKLASLKLSARDAQEISELDNLSTQLSKLLSENNNTTEIIASTSDKQIIAQHDPSLLPGIQELLIRLLEQLVVPTDLHLEVSNMKHQLEKEANAEDWKQLLKNVACLINSIRTHMQKEKHEFETFLQQVTERLKSMDNFLQFETNSFLQAQSEGEEFDQQVHLNVNKIRLDIDQATELTNLKQNVTTKLDAISGNIKKYREAEISRLSESQQEVTSMQSKMQKMESETLKLKNLLIQKNKQAMFDALTEIPNRLSYEKRAEEEIARWKRFKQPLSLAIWDIDLFKKVNDSYGHRAGDKVLKAVAQLLAKRIRTTDFLARYGGEEFVMLLPGTVQEETLALLNGLRKQIESCGFHFQGKSVTITASCGISCFGENDSLEKVFERADKALYRAKHNGRNQCVAAACLSS